MPRSCLQTVQAPCKVNLHLGIYAEKDARGYHRVDSVMVPVGLCNTISIESAPETSVAFEPALDGLVRGNATQPPLAAGWRSSLERRIPSGGLEAVADAARLCSHRASHPQRYQALGCSSADAGSVLRALADGIAFQRVIDVLKPVAFFLKPVPSLLRGAGDALEKTFPALAGMPLALVMPAGCASSTREVYEEFDRVPTAPESPDALCDALAHGDVSGVAAHLYNNLAPAAVRLNPPWGSLRRGLRGSRASLRRR